MNGLRFWAPSLSALYCVIWDIIDSSVPTAERIGGAFLGVLFLLPAFVHAHGILPREQ
jgi:hypothetical protein